MASSEGLRRLDEDEAPSANRYRDFFRWKSSANRDWNAFRELWLQR